MSANLGIKEFLQEAGGGMQVAPRMVYAQEVVTVIPANPKELPPDGGFKVCEVGKSAFPTLDDAAINAKPAAEQQRERTQPHKRFTGAEAWPLLCRAPTSSVAATRGFGSRSQAQRCATAAFRNSTQYGGRS